MQIFSKPYLRVGGNPESQSLLQKFLQALYPQQTIHWIPTPNFKEIDTYILFYICPYGVEEWPLLHQAIQRAKEILANKDLHPEAQIVIIFYRDLKVAFPERKLQREKVMSEMTTEEILHREALAQQDRIHVTHEFGLNNLQDTLQQLTGSHLYFEVNS